MNYSTATSEILSQRVFVGNINQLIWTLRVTHTHTHPLAERTHRHTVARRGINAWNMNRIWGRKLESLLTALLTVFLSVLVKSLSSLWCTTKFSSVCNRTLPCFFSGRSELIVQQGTFYTICVTPPCPCRRCLPLSAWTLIYSPFLSYFSRAHCTLNKSVWIMRPKQSMNTCLAESFVWKVEKTAYSCMEVKVFLNLGLAKLNWSLECDSK